MVLKIHGMILNWVTGMWGHRLIYVFLTWNVLCYYQWQEGPPRLLSSHPCTQVPAESLLPVPQSPLKYAQSWEEPWLVSTHLSKKAARIREVHPGIRRRGGAWGQRGSGDPLRRCARLRPAWARRSPLPSSVCWEKSRGGRCAPAPASWLRRPWPPPPRPRPCRRSTMWVRFFSTSVPL
jgi:hypothetical protein